MTPLSYLGWGWGVKVAITYGKVLSRKWDPGEKIVPCRLVVDTIPWDTATDKTWHTTLTHPHHKGRGRQRGCGGWEGENLQQYGSMVKSWYEPAISKPNPQDWACYSPGFQSRSSAKINQKGTWYSSLGSQFFFVIIIVWSHLKTWFMWKSKRILG